MMSHKSQQILPATPIVLSFLAALVGLWVVGCGDDDAVNPDNSTTLTDVDGNVYQTVKIGGRLARADRRRVEATGDVTGYESGTS